MNDLKQKLLELFRRAWPIFAIALLTSTFFWKALLLREVPIPGDFVVGVYFPWLDYKWGYTVGVPVKNPIASDVVSLIYPEQMLGVDLLKSGKWPLWNPYILTGTPLFADLQAAPFSPTILVYFLLDKLSAWSAQIILQHFLAALFTYILLRHWKISKLASIFGGIAFAFSGFNQIFSQWNGHTLSSAFIPLALYFEDRLLKEGKITNLLGLSFSLTFQLISGYPQVSLYTVVAIVILWLFRVWEDKKVIIKKTLLLISSGVLALSLSAFQLLPAAELWKLSQRIFEPIPFDWAFLPWVKIITLVAPDYFGNHATANYWGPQDYTSNTAYVGVVIFIFALLSINTIRKSKTTPFLLALAVFSLIISLPTPLSVFIWERNIFGMNAASAHRATILFDFAFCALGAFGLDYFLKTAKPKVKLSLLLPFILIGGFGLATLYLLIASKYNLGVYNPVVRGIPKYIVALRNLVIPGAIFIVASILILGSITFRRFRKLASILLFALMVLELFRFGWKYTSISPRRFIFPETPILEFLKSQKSPFRVTGSQVIPVNMRTPYALESLEGYETIHPLRISQFIAALNSGKPGTTPTGRYGIVDNDTSRLLDLVNTEYYLTLKTDENGNPSPTGKIPPRFLTENFRVAFEDKTTVVMQSKSYLPRAFMVYDWEVVKEDEKILDKLLDTKFPMDSKTILEEDPVNLEKGVIDKAASVTYVSQNGQQSLIKVATKDDGLLFVSDAYFPGWKAYLDGNESKIYRADFAFRAIVVPKGEHEVRFVYQPESFFKGLKISLISLGVAIFLLIIRKFSRRLL